MPAPDPLPHGGRLRAAQALHPDAPTPWLDLSTGINPTPYPIGPIPESAYTRLPEPEEIAALESAAAAAYGAPDPAMVVAAPGTQCLIHLLPRLFPSATASVVSPTYAEHAAAWRQAGTRITEAPDLIAAPVQILCNPNNPDGRRHPHEQLLASPARLLVVDEAFADFEGPSLAESLPHPGLVVLRSFGKSYGLAGLRLGFALADPNTAALIRIALGPWPVSGPAIHVGRIALADADWRAAAAARLADEAARLDRTLTDHGAQIIGGTRLFRLVRHRHASRLATDLAEVGILVRQFDGHSDWLRFGIPPPWGWQRLDQALRAQLSPATTTP